MSRWKAAGLHLLLSAAVISTVAMLVMWLWYPLALLHVAGIDRLIGLIALVDVTVGPLLTLIVYKHGKRGLKFDLSLIALVQAALLGYGLHTLSLKRPVFLVGVVDRFELVTANQISEQDLQAAQPPYNHLSWTGAMLVGAPLPEDPQQRSDLMFEAIEGHDIHVQPRYFAALERVLPSLFERALPLSAMIEQAPPLEKNVLREAGANAPDAEIAALPLATSNGNATMLLDRRTGALLGPVAVDFWKATRKK